MLTSYTFEDWLSSHCISILFAESITWHWKVVWTCEIHSHNPLVRNPRWNVKLFFLLNYTTELQRLEHLKNHENMFETGLVRANEC